MEQRVILGNLYEDVKDYNQIMRDAASQIADLYLERFPRECSYGVNLSSSDDDSEMTCYHRFTSEELDILRKCSQIAKEEDCTLHEVLNGDVDVEPLNGDELAKLLDRLLEHDVPMCLDILDSVDLDHPLKFTKFLFQKFDFKPESTQFKPLKLGVAMTDEEFKEVMTELLIRSNRYSLNNMVYDKSEIAQHIMCKLAYSSCDGLFECHTPFVCEMTELKDCVGSVLNPFKDVLGLFESTDKTLRGFVRRNQIVPETGELYCCCDDADWFHVLVNFEGTNVSISQEGITSEGQFHDTDEFVVPAAVIMQCFSIDQPEGIFPYLKEHYNTRDCFGQLRAEFKDDILNA